MTFKGITKSVTTAFRALLKVVGVLAPVAETVGTATGNPGVVAGASVAAAAAKVATKELDELEKQ